jgi:hypothetical protein
VERVDGGGERQNGAGNGSKAAQSTPRPTRQPVSTSVLKLTSADALRLASCVGSLVGV